MHDRKAGAVPWWVKPGAPLQSTRPSPAIRTNTAIRKIREEFPGAMDAARPISRKSAGVRSCGIQVQRPTEGRRRFGPRLRHLRERRGYRPEKVRQDERGKRGAKHCNTSRGHLRYRFAATSHGDLDKSMITCHRVILTIAARYVINGPSSVRKACNDCANKRETCICESPTFSAISACVSSPKNR